MAFAPDTSSQENTAAQRPKKKAPFKFLVPLIYAPVLPLIRLSLRRNPVLRDRLFTAVLIGAFVHGGYLVHLRSREQIKMGNVGVVNAMKAFSYRQES